MIHLNHKIRAIVFCGLALGLFSEQALSYGFGDDWQFATCKNKKKKSVNFKHTGIDIGSSVGKRIIINDHLLFFGKHEYSDGWRWGVIATTSDGKATYLFLHMENVPNFQSGQDLFGKQIGTIADLGKKSTPHLHLGYRGKKPDWNLSLKGALPPSECTSGKQSLPDFPEAFKKPNTGIVTISR